jgi:hypothetical protein
MLLGEKRQPSTKIYGPGNLKGQMVNPIPIRPTSRSLVPQQQQQAYSKIALRRRSPPVRMLDQILFLPR